VTSPYLSTVTEQALLLRMTFKIPTPGPFRAQQQSKSMIKDIKRTT